MFVAVFKALGFPQNVFQIACMFLSYRVQEPGLFDFPSWKLCLKLLQTGHLDSVDYTELLFCLLAPLTVGTFFENHSIVPIDPSRDPPASPLFVS